MFRKRHVHIGPADLTMAPGEAVSFYGKDRHVHGVLGRARRAAVSSTPIERAEDLQWIEFYHRSTSMVTWQTGNCP